MSIEVKEGHNKFYVGDESNPTAEITYVPLNDEVWEADHTFVDESLRGQGVAGQLFDHLIEKAKKEDVKIKPSCSYVDLKFKKDPSLQDLRYES
ncbi:GNAT family N-acetyltransferase [Staphylococcus massiliensis]|uniref:GNAT family acetyltransferase n=1 Tax=Staphylococcus massiliensis S46 TaxID=1229783 RepID=K9AHV3_9STAP|nr:GNAT family N-acetyltransferase [Staphylococcus massiliensis]EKU46868.1 GNAT family acetyltransferase [Staphylococcus massiliensis S46]MCG3399917.1 N-acetyltransferase [Staphylococcus massiliensis]MCG3402636.1 N-acetyltransferase [Staphylococcus massiliensis]MCG3412883.1 N-acetyltransferase [Staphylococcus massiliensis]PNZ98104.1 N-acetyltransferase [Staphylococcus massiliensis CCUG 55927]